MPGSSAFSCSTANTILSAGISYTNTLPTCSGRAQCESVFPIRTLTLPPWNTTSFSAPPSSTLPSGPETIAPVLATSSSNPGGASQHIGAITAGAIGATALLLLLVGILLYFHLRKGGSA